MYNVLLDKTKQSENAKLEIWRHTSKSKGFKLNRVKNGYIEYMSSTNTNVDDVIVKLEDKSIDPIPASHTRTQPSRKTITLT